jgi:hypothetical protein
MAVRPFEITPDLRELARRNVATWAPLTADEIELLRELLGPIRKRNPLPAA